MMFCWWVLAQWFIPAMQVAEILSEHGIQATVVNARFAKPLDTELILPLAKQIGRVVTLEEGCLIGGFGSAVAEALLDADVVVPVKRLGVPDILVDHAEPDESKAAFGFNNSTNGRTNTKCFFQQTAICC